LALITVSATLQVADAIIRKHDWTLGSDAGRRT
jgi:hypothetical protein